MKLTNIVGLKTTIIFLVLGFLIGFVLRSVLAGKQLDKRAFYSNGFEIEQIQQGDKVRNMVLVKRVPYKSEDTLEFTLNTNIDIFLDRLPI